MLSESAVKPVKLPDSRYAALDAQYAKEQGELADEITDLFVGRYIFNHLVLSDELFPHLNEVDEQAQHLLDTIIPPMVKAAGVTEQLKATEQLKWVGLMNVVKAQVEEIIFTKLIYI